MSISEHLCAYCRHFNSEERMKTVCEAFPNGIPREIAFDGFDHHLPYPGDHGIRFDPDPSSAIAMRRYGEDRQAAVGAA